MLRNLYYSIKPFVPRRALIAFRRNLIRFQRSMYADVWPIDEKAGNSPEGWQGWPEGKQFALILTHDVETIHGYKKCEKLINLEKEAGFRSSFNFVPERYDVSPELRNLLVNNGFEVGMHGLYHDGKLYKSKKIFMERAEKINHYMKEWKAVGFRSPSMHSNLEWLHALDIKYDASTFDTDPFEPQTGGVCTIFPFLATDSSTQKSYVELPYTLSQDSTLFIFMGEDTIDIWKRKLDWIAEKGGMALLATHPDYMNFEDSNEEIGEYPVKLYIEFLNYIKEKYEGKYWAALPKDMAGHCKRNSSRIRKIDTAHIKKPNVLMIVESIYPEDTRVRNEAKTLKKFYNITVLSLKGKESYKFHESMDGVEVFRIPELKSIELFKGRYVESIINKANYMFQYLYITISSLLFFLITFIKRRYKIVHVHNPPDTLFVIGLVSKIFFSKFIYDHHDLSPELYLTKYGSNKGCLYRILVLFEKISCKLANVVISTNESYKEIEIKRHNLNPQNIFIVRNNPIISECLLKSDGNVIKREKGKTILLYLGNINAQDGFDVLLKSLFYLKNNLAVTEFICYVLGSGDCIELMQQITDELNLLDNVKFKGFISEREVIKEYLSLSDICVEPAPENELNMHSTFIKIMEYMAAGKPIVAFDLKETRYSADNSAILLPSGDVKGFANAIKRLIDDPLLRKKLGEAGSVRIRKGLNWDKASLNLIEAYKSLFV